jgi:hypothetical protein
MPSTLDPGAIARLCHRRELRPGTGRFDSHYTQTRVRSQHKSAPLVMVFITPYHVRFNPGVTVRSMFSDAHHPVTAH